MSAPSTPRRFDGMDTVTPVQISRTAGATARRARRGAA